jgi:hypothetical protein
MNQNHSYLQGIVNFYLISLKYQIDCEATPTYLKLHDQWMFTDDEKHVVTCCITLMIELNVCSCFAWNNPTSFSDFALQEVMTLQPTN